MTLSTLTAVLLLVSCLAVMAAGFRRPALGLSIVLLFYGVEQALFAAWPGLLHASWIPNVIVAVFLLVLAGQVSGTSSERQPAPRRRPVVFVAVCTYVGLYWLTTLLAGAPNAPSLLATEIASFGAYVVLPMLLLRTPNDAALVASGIRVLGAVSCAAVVANPRWWAPGMSRLVLELDDGRLGNPLALADMAALSFLLLVLPTPHRDWTRILLYALSGFALFIVFRASRGESAAAVLLAGAALPLARRVRRPAQTLGLLTAAAALAALIWFSIDDVTRTPYIARWGMYRVGLDDRLHLLSRSLEDFLREPWAWWLGLGGHAQETRYGVGSYPHNQAVQALVETGVIGLTVWLSIHALTLRRLWSFWRGIRFDPLWRLSACYLSIIYLYFLILSFKRGAVMNLQLFLAALLVERLGRASFKPSEGSTQLQAVHPAGRRSALCRPPQGASSPVRVIAGPQS